jgi:hypothetical protein
MDQSRLMFVRTEMGQIFTRTAAAMILTLGALALYGCSTPAEKPVETPPPPVAVAPAPEPSKSVMFDSDPKGEWNIFPDPTSGDIGVYHKGDYVGSVDGSEKDDPPAPHPSPNHRPDDDDDAD